MTAQPRAPSAADSLRWAGLVMLLYAASVKALVAFIPLPFWDTDPAEVTTAIGEPAAMPLVDVLMAPMTGLGPSGSLLLDALALLGAGLALAGEGLRRAGLRPVETGLIAAGSVGVLVHPEIAGGGDLDQVRLGWSWMAALWTGLAAVHLARDARCRGVMLGVGFGLLVMMLAKGIVQVLHELPATIAQYEADRESFLAARGWSEDSAMAAVYERRLMQPAASGWFGLSNVFATFAAGGFAVMAGTCVWSAVLALRGRVVWWRVGVLGALGLGGAVGVVLAGAKGGYGAAMIGAAVSGLVLWRGLKGEGGGSGARGEGSADLSVSGGAEGESEGEGDTGAVQSESEGDKAQGSVPPQSNGDTSRRAVPPEAEHRPRGGVVGGTGILLRVVGSERGGVALALGLVVVGLLAVVVRGGIGERIGELSLLFRWYYMQGAVRVFGEQPLFGVGPAGFKDAYVRVRPSTSPEEVTSPHSLILDYSATLGVFGLAFAAAWLVWVALCGRGLARSVHRGMAASSRPDGDAEGGSAGVLGTRVLVYLCGGIAVGAAMTAMMLERGTSLPLVIASALAGEDGELGMGLLLAGLGLWCGLVAAWAVCAAVLVRVAERSALVWGFACAGAIAMAVHAQIEMTPVQPGSVSLFMLLIGAAAGAGVSAPRAQHAPPLDRRGVRARGWTAGGLVPGALAGVLVVFVLPGVVSWERSLGAAARQVAPIGEAATMLREAQRMGGPAGRERIAEVARLVGQRLHRPPPRTPEEFSEAFAEWQEVVGQRASGLLDEAAAAFPDHLPTQRAATLQLLRLAESADQRGAEEEAAALVGEAEARAQRLAERHPRRASGWGWLASLRQARAGVLGDEALLEGAIEALEMAAQHDPYGLPTVWRLFDLSDRLGDEEGVHRWGERALELDELMRLDPLRRLTDDQRARVERALEGP